MRSNPAKRLHYAAKSRAKKSGIEFTISPHDIVIPAACPVLGVPLSMSGGSRHEYGNSPSLDRIDASKGYVPGNIAVISNRANRIKNDATAAELRAVVRWLEDIGDHP